jgi:hypothetical protein
VSSFFWANFRAAFQAAHPSCGQHDSFGNLPSFEPIQQNQPRPDTNFLKGKNDHHSSFYGEPLLIQPRAYPKVTNLPCYEDDPTTIANNFPNPRRQNHTHGILFVKPMKVGGSTVSGIQLRIAVQRNCTVGTFKHTLAKEFAGRSKSESFLYSWLRDPTSRVVSEWFHFYVARRKFEPTDANFLKFIQNGKLRSQNYYINVHSMQTNENNNIEPDGIIHDKNAPSTVPSSIDLSQISSTLLSNYNFMGITERFDESVVVLQLILGLSTSDVLYLKAKSSGGFDGGSFKDKCFFIVPSFVSRGMREYFESHEWRERIKYDQDLYRAANRSLDRTIDETIGRDVFDKALGKFRHAQQLVQLHCASTVKFPCSEGGEKRPINETDCLWGDSGCGNACVDHVVSNYNLY